MSKGKQYGTKASAFYTIVQAADPIRHPRTGDIIGYQKELIAEAAVHGKEVNVTGPDGSTLKVGDVRGHFIDTAAQAEAKGWTDEERERVEARLDFWCEQQPGQIWHLEEAKVPAPWPTYDEMHGNAIAPFAKQAGMVAEALAYERQRENPRQGTIATLEEMLAAERQDALDEAALTAA